jgi:predicted aspartyl protease
MRIKRLRFTFSNPNDPARTTDTDLIVDTESILTWLSESKLEGIGVKPKREKTFRTIEGRVIPRSTSGVTIRYGGIEADIEVVFAKETDAEVLGVTALESLGYQVDPVSNELHQSSLIAL